MFRSIAILELSAFFLWLSPPPRAYPFQLVASPLFEPADRSVSLTLAIHHGRLDIVKALLGSGADINATDPAGNTPLIAAVLAGKAAIVSYLLSQHADPNLRPGEAKAGALLYAVAAGRPDLVKSLLAAGANVALRYDGEQTILHFAASGSNTECLDLILAAHADIAALAANGNTPLDEAVLHGRTVNASLLLHHGADVRRVRDSDGRGVLDEACVKGYGGLVSVLIEAGADPASRDRWGQTPIDLALAYKNRAAVAVLLELAPRNANLPATISEAMERAVGRGRTEIVSMLLGSGWDPNRPTLAGSSYLNDAALKGQSKVVRLLLDRGARLDIRNQTGGTPLHDAALAGNTEVIGLLLDRGSPINARDLESGATPLMMAVSLGRIEAVALLLKRGANPALKDKSGHTALNRARDGQDPAVVKLLEAAQA